MATQTNRPAEFDPEQALEALRFDLQRLAGAIQADGDSITRLSVEVVILHRFTREQIVEMFVTREHLVARGDWD